MANKFKAGDVVQLISGGPAMTVDQVPGDERRSYPNNERDDYRVEWFKGATPAHGEYAEHLLKAFVAPK